MEELEEGHYKEAEAGNVDIVLKAKEKSLHLKIL